jgi:hypothetical protein
MNIGDSRGHVLGHGPVSPARAESAEEWGEVRKAVWARGWVRWEELTDLDRLLIRYEAPGIDWAAYEWCRDGEEWLVRPARQPDPDSSGPR